MVRVRNNNLWKTLKDYTVPFFWFLLILVLLYSVFSWSSDENIDSNNTSTWIISKNEVNVTLWWADSIAYIIYDNWKKVEITDTISLWKSEKISVESWNVDINFPFFAQMKLSKNGEFTYNEDWTFNLDSGNLWLESMKDIEIFMKYSSVKLPIWSVANLNQNEIESTIYSLKQNIDISNLAWININLPAWDKLSISSKNSTETEIDLESLKTPIDNYFKLSAWFTINNWEELLNKNVNSTWSLLSNSWTVLKEDISWLFTFDNITDESYSTLNPIDLKWRYSPTELSKITINNRETVLNKELWVFSLNWFILENKVNDIVVKLFDNNKNIISKKIFTIYSNNPTKSTESSVSNAKNIETFAIKSTDFVIYEPSKTWKFTTTSSQVTIRWQVSNKDVAKVSVNDYSLQSFNWSTWRYHAFVEQGTLKNWANNYEIKYLDKDSKVIYKEYYSIYKEGNTWTSTKDKDTIN